MKRVLVIGSCVIDIFHHEDEFMCLGGDAVNQTITLSKLDCLPIIASLIGEDDFSFIQDYLKRFNVDSTGIRTSNTYKTTVSHIYFDELKERSFKVQGGAHRHFRKDDFDYSLLKNIDALSIASLFSMEDFEKDGLLELLMLCREEGISTFMDTSTDRNHTGIEGFKSLLPYVDYFMPGYDEIASSLGINDIDDIFDCLHNNGARNIVLKCGENGAILSDGKTRTAFSSYKFSVNDTSGCGDNFCAAFISSVIHGFSIEESCRNACFTGSYNVQFKGAHYSNIQYKKMISRNVK